MTKRKKTPKRLTKRERQAIVGKGPSGSPKGGHEAQHIHCVACGRHLDPGEFNAKPATASWTHCDHGTRFASCTDCLEETQRRLAEHDRTGKPVQTAGAWH